MEHLAEILHDLIDAGRHALNANRVGELHGMASEIADAVKGAGEAPAETATENVTSSYDRSNPADRAAEIAELEREIADLRALDAPPAPATPAPAVPVVAPAAQ